MERFKIDSDTITISVMGCPLSRTIDKVRIKHSKGCTIGDDNPAFCPDDQGNNSPAPDSNNGDMRGKGEAVFNGKDPNDNIAINSPPGTFRDPTGTGKPTTGCDQSALLQSQDGYELVNYRGFEEPVATEKKENGNINRIEGSDDLADSEQISAQTVSDGEGTSDDEETNVSGTSTDTPLPAKSTNRDENFSESHSELEDNNKEVSTTEVEENVGQAHETERGDDAKFDEDKPSTSSDLNEVDNATTGGDPSALPQSQNGHNAVNHGGCEELIATEKTENNNTNGINGRDDVADSEQIGAQTVSDGEGTSDDEETNVSGTSTDPPLPSGATTHDATGSHGEPESNNKEVPPTDAHRIEHDGTPRRTDSITNHIGVGLALPYRQMLLDVKNGMRSQDLKDAKFLIRRDPQSLEAAVFPDGVLERIDVLGLFESLERKNYLSQNNLIFLQFILFGIGRTDLLNRVAEFASQRGDSLSFHTNYRNEPEGHAYVEFRFKGSLLNFDRISLEEFQELLESVLGIPKRHINLTELKPGSVIATFQLPIACIGNLQKLIAEKPSSLAYHRVNAVRISNGQWIRLENQEHHDSERAELLAELDNRQKQVVRLHCDLEKAETEIVELRSIVRKMTAIQQIENTNEKRYAKVMLPGDLKQEQLPAHNTIGPGVKKAKAETHDERQYENVIVSSGAIGKEADSKPEKGTAMSLKEWWKARFLKRGKKSKTRKRSSSPQEQSGTAEMEGSLSETNIYPKGHKFTQEKTDSQVEDYHEIYDDNVVEETDKVLQETKKMAVQETRKQKDIPLDEPSHYISLNMEEKDNHRYSTLQNQYEKLST